MTRSSWPIRGALAFVVLVYLGRIQEILPFLSSWHPALLAILVTGLALSGTDWWGRLRNSAASPQARATVLLIVVASLGIPFSLWRAEALDALVAFLKIIIVFPLLVCGVRTPEDLRWVTLTFVICAGLLIFAYIAESFGMHDLTSVHRTFDRNDVTLIAVMALPFALLETGREGWGKVYGYSLGLILIAGVVATGSRGGFLALCITGIAFLLLTSEFSKSKKLLLLSGAVVVLVGVGSGAYWERISNVVTSPTADYNFGSRYGRIEIWKRGLGYIAERPLLGVGIGNFPVAEGHSVENIGYGVKWSAAHNSFLQVAVELGVGGLIAFVAILVFTYKTASRIANLNIKPRAPAIRTLKRLGDATRYSVVAFCSAGMFLSMSYSAPFVFIVSVGTILWLLQSQLQVRVRRILAAQLSVSHRAMSGEPRA